MSRIKPFNPKPWQSGARISWRHFYPDGRVIERKGTVWDRAPSVDGAVVVSWVVPDEPLASDLYAAIAVGKANARSVAVHGRYVDLPPSGDQWASKGEAYSSNLTSSPLGNLTARAASRAADDRRLIA